MIRLDVIPMNEDQYADIRAQLAANEAEHKDIKRRLESHAESLKKLSDILVAIERQGEALVRMGRRSESLSVCWNGKT